MDIASVVGRVATLPGFGQWSAFKVADMIDATLGATVEQDNISMFLYDTPRASIIECWERGEVPRRSNHPDPALGLADAMTWLRQHLSDVTIPHKVGQPPDNFSLETVWCKYKSHRDGHYPPFKDCVEIAAGLQDWLPHASGARAFFDALPRPRAA